MIKDSRKHVERKINEEFIFYKIKNKKTGEFSLGGKKPKFDKVGKIWRDHFIKYHLRQVDPKYYEDCEIVVYETKIKGKENILEKIKEYSEE